MDREIGCNRNCLVTIRVRQRAPFHHGFDAGTRRHAG